MNLSIEKIIEVRFHEVDSLNIVWHGYYIQYFESGREAFGDAHNIGYKAMRENHVAVPIVKVNCEYKYPLKYGDRARVVATYVYSPAAKIIFEYKIFNHETDVLVATGRTEQVFTDPISGELLLTYPEFLNDWLANFKNSQ